MKISNLSVNLSDEFGQNLRFLTINSVPSDIRKSDTFSLQPNETKSLISGSVPLQHDNTTIYSLSFVSGNTYRLNYISGTNPVFRVSRTHLADNTSSFSITKSGKTAIISLTGGASPSFDSTVLIGDFLQIRNLNISNLNLGIFKVLSVSANEIVIENPDAVEETFTLSSNADFNIFSSNGVQKENKLSLAISGFINDVFTITEVTNEYLEFNSTSVIANNPSFSYSNGTVDVFSSTAKLTVISSDIKCTVTMNGKSIDIEPVLSSTGTFNSGLFVTTEIIKTLTITNNQTNSANITFFQLG